ncbi:MULTISPECIES: hypothetical protein [unclassified Undibacterium]|uniref:hypothetical protein n=1 Tax=unclassified Undibacterium TaxID=2630295 RepID=UPI002AC8FEBE|nr:MULTISPECIES: hypothetical protein [unclassified Undibacterium]MEB0140211.1 hypothetical protein [Undibacterium sp. CCC2.1]MEB0173250.1 hypothetical protein [Undibacterium sp. CCC1.1]MEB0177061.1 hypothetical protein [Undibacterium sp. CCC3.4]MEB0216358.1 hypothetical protein [Undibacterium sp. 5I2]WPX45211.1 hypothetical protein RHM61_08325 [Undibacterium sp. CCC3.4]
MYRPNMLSILRNATVLLLAASAATAMAQSQEYRQGYDQGYRDGMNARGHEEQRESGRIVILAARYGIRNEACDATESIRRIASGRRRAEFVANNNLCGDPAQGRPKQLWVEFRCGESQTQRAEASESGQISLYCRD